MAIGRKRGTVVIATVALLALGMIDAQAQDSQTTLAGTVTGEGGAPVSGAQILVTDQATGATTGGLSGTDGRFSIPDVRAGGPYRVDVFMLGYGRQTVEGLMVEAGGSLTLDFELTTEAIAVDAIEIFATRAVDRRTPVAFSNVPKVQIQNQLGSRDLPLVLNLTPSVYATAQGGGAGDARINVRGFSQRNTAVMINGVPVNDMENGWVYWSNWDGLGDASTSIQLQRGLSAVNLATPSIGGTLNVITDPAGQEASFSYKSELGVGALDGDGDWGLGTNLFKQTFILNTGEVNGFAFTGSLVRKVGEGVYHGVQTDGGAGPSDATWADAWAYYGALSYQLNARNRIDLFAVGAPQRHGQNLWKLNAGTLSHSFASSLEGYDAAALEKFSEAGRQWSPNVASVSCNYLGQQYSSTGPGGGSFRDRRDCSYLNERENYFHKPQVNLNWYSYFGGGLTLSTVAYYSGGAGGGGGTYGSMAWDYQYTQRFVDWDATIERNRANDNGSRGILRNSVNNQRTLGAISKLRKDFANGLTAEVGVDWRTARIEHYREVRDLLGGTFYYCPSWCASDFWSEDERRRGLGDKIAYHNENAVNWLGAHAQAEYSTEGGSVYAMGGIAQNSYDFEDFFNADPDDRSQTLKISSGTLTGFQAKGGAVRNLNREWSIFTNAGYVSKVPIFDGVIDDNRGQKFTDPQNEKFLSFEGGLTYRSLNRAVSADINFYHTTWRDRTTSRFIADQSEAGNDQIVNIFGLDARHQGIEAELAYQPDALVRFDAALSLGNWEYLSDVAAQGAIPGTDQTWDYNLYLAGLKVADAPQTQLALSASVFPAPGMYLAAVMRAYGNHYASFNPVTRTDSTDRAQAWQPPGYRVFDFNWSYRVNDLFRMRWQGDMRFFANVYNVFDALYVQDAVDNSRFNAFDYDHDADDAEIFLGYPRNLNLGIQVSF